MKKLTIAFKNDGCKTKKGLGSELMIEELLLRFPVRRKLRLRGVQLCSLQKNKIYIVDSLSNLWRSNVFSV